MHGWVVPLPGGAKARCGGPALCPDCQKERGELVDGWLAAGVAPTPELRPAPTIPLALAEQLVEELEAATRSIRCKSACSSNFQGGFGCECGAQSTLVSARAALLSYRAHREKTEGK